MLINVRFALIILDFDVKIFKIPLRCSWLLVISPDKYREMVNGFHAVQREVNVSPLRGYYYFATTWLGGIWLLGSINMSPLCGWEQS